MAAQAKRVPRSSPHPSGRAAEGASSAGRWRVTGMTIASAACFALLGLAIYSNTYRVPFVFDDLASIVENSTIRDLANPAEIFLHGQRGGTTIDGRPLLNFSLALNYAFGALDPTSYHAVNIGLHVANACLLFALLRRVLALPSLPPELNQSANPLAFCIALLWLAHPLQTAAVTYVIQRAEVLMALFYLGTLYCFVRAVTAERPRNWTWATVLCCWLGQGAKEIMATAPLAILALDAALVAGSLRSALQQRGRMYLLLAGSWLLAAVLIIHSGSRSGTVGFGDEVSSWDYFVAQCGYLLHYLKLCVWPWPQVFDYGRDIPPWDGSQWPQVVAICLLIVGIFVIWWRKPKWGLLGIIPLLILAPTSSFIPVITQVAAEHRLYLPLACVLAALVLLCWWGLRQLPIGSSSARDAILVAGSLLLAIVEAQAAHVRNRDFATLRSLWEDTVRKRPENIRACDNLAMILTGDGQAALAPALYEPAIAAGRNLAAAHCGRGEAWMMGDNNERAVLEFQAALQADPNCDRAYFDRCLVHLLKRDDAQALVEIDRALAVAPRNGRYLAHRGIALARLQRYEEALSAHCLAIECFPGSAETHFQLAEFFRQRGKQAAAIASYQTALYCKCDYTEAERALIDVYTEQGDYARALKLASQRIELWNEEADWLQFSTVIEATGDPQAAVNLLDEAVQRYPRSVALRLRQGKLFAQLRRWNDSFAALRQACKLAPHSADAAAALATTLHFMGNPSAAQHELQRALSIDPRHPAALKLKAALEAAQPQ